MRSGDRMAAGPPGQMPAWLAELSLRRGTGGHRATAADRARALAAYEARRGTGRPAAGGRVLASLRGTDGMSPVTREIFGLPR